jgi:uncharacterized RDD family membrane protein YckC
MREPGERSTLEMEPNAVPPPSARPPADQKRSPPLSALVRDGQSGESTGTRSSPWAQSKAGGALSAGAHDFQEEPTVAEIPIMSRRDGPDPQPSIAKVGFTGPQNKPNPARPSAQPKRPFASDERSSTEEVPLDTRRKAKGDRPWDELIDSTADRARALGSSRVPSERGPTSTPPLTHLPNDLLEPPTPSPTAPRVETTRQRIQAINRAPDPKIEDRGPRARPKAPIDPAATPPAPVRSDELIANRPVNSSARFADIEKIRDLDTPAAPGSFGSRVNPSGAPHEDTRLAAPGELAGPAGPGPLSAGQARLRASDGDPNPSGRPRDGGKKAGTADLFPDKTLPPRPRPTPGAEAIGGPTIAAPGELAGLIADLHSKPSAKAAKAIPTPVAKPTERDLMNPVALASPLDSSLPMRTRTEPEASAAPIRPTKTPALHSVLRPTIEPTSLRPPPDSRIDDGQISMPGSAIPVSDTLRPIQRRDVLGIADVRAVTDAIGTEPTLTLELASGRRRALALLIDAAVVALPIAIPMMLGLFGQAFRAISYIDPDDVSGLIITGAYKKPLIGVLVVMVIYSALMHALSGRTVGKLALGLELVATKNGERPKPVRAVVRSLLALVGVVSMGGGYLWLIVDRRSRAIHDWLTGTAVVVSKSRVHSG